MLIEPGSIDTHLRRRALDTADEVEEAMEPEHRELYGGQISAMRRAVARIQRQTAPAETVVAAVETALTAARPRARYLLGPDARAQVALRTALAARAIDAALTGLTTRA